jgi:hypothetical protein
VSGATVARGTGVTTALLVRSWVLRDAGVLAALLLASLAMLLPVLPDPRGHILGWPGDNVQYVYMTGWVSQSLLLGQSPFFDPRLNYPDGLFLVATDAPFLAMLAAAPATWALGPVFGYNLIFLLGALLSGYFAYLWVVALTGSRFGGLVAGLIFVLTPYRLAHSYGHLQLISTQGLPLFFWALDRAARERPTLHNLLPLAGATLLVGGLCQYYLIICLATGPAYVLLAKLPRLWWLARYGWRVAAAVALGALGSALPYLAALNDRVYVTRAVEDTRMWSADPLNFLLPSRFHPLWGALVEGWRPEPLWVEKTLYLGAAPLALVAVALLGRGLPGRRPWVWLGTALWGALLALGTDLHIGGEPVGDPPVWLPAYYLAQLPFADLMRTWSRFGVVTVLFVALLAGVGAARLIRLIEDRGWLAPPSRARGAYAALLPAAMLLPLCVDLLPGAAEVTAIRPRPVDLWLAEQPGDFVIAALPARNDQVNYRTSLGSLYHARHAVAYNHPDHLPRAYREFMRLAAPFPGESSFVRLRQLGIHYLLLEKRLFDGTAQPGWPEVEAALATEPGGARVVAELDGVVVVALRGR